MSGNKSGHPDLVVTEPSLVQLYPTRGDLFRMDKRLIEYFEEYPHDVRDFYDVLKEKRQILECILPVNRELTKAEKTDAINLEKEAIRSALGVARQAAEGRMRQVAKQRDLEGGRRIRRTRNRKTRNRKTRSQKSRR